MTEKEELIEFHTNRIAFLIINDNIIFLQNSMMSHREWFNTLNLNINFDSIIRGFIYNNRIVVYEGNFTFNENTISVAKKYYPIIKNKFNLNNPELWCGQNKTDVARPITNPWLPTKRII